MAPGRRTEIAIPDSYTELPFSHIKVSHHPEDATKATPVVIVTLNRPKQRNAFTLQMTEELEAIFPMLDLDERVKCIVLTGAGETFCAGADLQMGFSALGREDRLLDNRDTGGRVNLAMFRCRKPTICAMNGSAAGVGMTMTLAASIRIVHASSKYGFPFSQRGITMESNSSFFLPRLIGFSDAMYLLTIGDALRGDSKFFRSLFHEVLENKQDVLKRALELATHVADKTSGLASYLSRELMWRGPPTPEETHILESAIGFSISSSSDVREGVNSFFEKRKPNFEATLEKNAPPLYPWWRETDVGPTRPKKAHKSKL